MSKFLPFDKFLKLLPSYITVTFDKTRLDPTHATTEGFSSGIAMVDYGPSVFEISGRQSLPVDPSTGQSAFAQVIFWGGRISNKNSHYANLGCAQLIIKEHGKPSIAIVESTSDDGPTHYEKTSVDGPWKELPNPQKFHVDLYATFMKLLGDFDIELTKPLHGEMS